MNPAARHSIFAAALAAALAVAAPAAAAGDGRVPLPEPPKAKGAQCVAPVETMRRYHGLFLQHQRDETTRKGIRGNKYSLKECVACHAAPDPEAGGAETVRPFCAACHDYAAVAIDCFSCHAIKPAPGKGKP